MGRGQARERARVTRAESRRPGDRRPTGVRGIHRVRRGSGCPGVGGEGTPGEPWEWPPRGRGGARALASRLRREKKEKVKREERCTKKRGGKRARREERKKRKGREKRRDLPHGELSTVYY